MQNFNPTSKKGVFFLKFADLCKELCLSSSLFCTSSEKLYFKLNEKAKGFAGPVIYIDIMIFKALNLLVERAIVIFS